MEKTGTFRGPYTIVLHPDPEEGGFGVVVPSLPGVMAEGNSRDEAVAAASRAIEEYIHARPARPPDPTSRFRSANSGDRRDRLSQRLGLAELAASQHRPHLFDHPVTNRKHLFVDVGRKVRVADDEFELVANLQAIVGLAQFDRAVLGR